MSIGYNDAWDRKDCMYAEVNHSAAVAKMCEKGKGKK